MTPDPRVSAIVVSFNTREDTLRCLRSLRQTVRLPLEILVADNDSRDGSVEAIRQEFPDAIVLEMRANVGFGAANNRALDRASAPHILFINSDAEVRPGAVEALVGALETHPGVALAGPRTLNADGTVQLSWGPALTPLNEWRQRRWIGGVASRDPRVLAGVDTLARREHRPAWVSGSCMLARREALRAICGFDEGYFLYEEDADLCARLRARGGEVLFVPAAEVVHHGGRSAPAAGTRARLEYHRSHLRYYYRHNGPWAALLLRAWILAQASVGWLLARDGGGSRSAARRHWRAVARLALRGPGSPDRYQSPSGPGQ
jgi:N-acetylglucosaminyl-diphospho-decaprenol L-rhamnosyltransferase